MHFLFPADAARSAFEPVSNGLAGIRILRLEAKSYRRYIPEAAAFHLVTFPPRKQKQPVCLWWCLGAGLFFSWQKIQAYSQMDAWGTSLAPPKVGCWLPDAKAAGNFLPSAPCDTLLPDHRWYESWSQVSRLHGVQTNERCIHPSKCGHTSAGYQQTTFSINIETEVINTKLLCFCPVENS